MGLLNESDIIPSYSVEERFDNHVDREISTFCCACQENGCYIVGHYPARTAHFISVEGIAAENVEQCPEYTCYLLMFSLQTPKGS